MSDLLLASDDHPTKEASSCCCTFRSNKIQLIIHEVGRQTIKKVKPAYCTAKVGFTEVLNAWHPVYQAGLAGGSCFGPGPGVCESDHCEYYDRLIQRLLQNASIKFATCMVFTSMNSTSWLHLTLFGTMSTQSLVALRNWQSQPNVLFDSLEKKFLLQSLHWVTFPRLYI